MRLSAFTAIASSVALVLAAEQPAPDYKRSNDDKVNDVTVLQYALTLEHLENAFYGGALAQYDDAAFKKAGFPDWVRGRFVQIAEHETSHVSFLSNALGDQVIQPCDYTFPYTDPRSMAALSVVLEGVGTSAYLGAARFIENKDYLTAAASILAVEAQHDAWVSSAVEQKAGWDTAYETPLGLSGVYSLASQFIKSCPPSNPPLPVKRLPSLTLVPGAPAPGSSVNIQTKGLKKGAKQFVAWFVGLQVMFSEVNGNATTVPDALARQGTVYAALVSSDSSAPKDDQLMSGLVVVPFESTSKDL